MPFAFSDTAVTYPSGATASTGTVTHILDLPDGRRGVVLDRTALHPVDGHWPDQPADRGTLDTGSGAITVLDAVVGATDGAAVALDAQVPVRTGTDGWAFAVVHVIDGSAHVAVGDAASIQVDAAYRRALSIGHTACHLASLALDRALAGAWAKDVPVDALGAPAFDALAISASRILEHGSRDDYRIGKSLRRNGFDPSAFDDPGAVAAAVEAILAVWIASDAAVGVEAPDAALGARRTWVCEILGGTARIPCGGTHVDRLGELGRVGVRFEVADVPGAREVVMHTVATG